ncbi:MAG: AsmA family protein, partial [Devosia sp.]|nr:AsmA family protein [Devosia sp.]
TGGQVITWDGALGAGEVSLRAELGSGIAAIPEGQLRLTASLDADDAAALSQQIGLGDSQVFQGAGMLVSVGLRGIPVESLGGSINASSDDEHIGFAAEALRMIDGEIHGNGRLTLDLADAGALARIAGAYGLSLPQARGSADLYFEGDRLARLVAIAGVSGSTGFSGDLSLSRTASMASIAGAILVDAASLEGLAATMLGPHALAPGAAMWPNGTILIGDQPRQTRGTVSVRSPAVTIAGEPRLGAASFELSWDDTRLRLNRFEAALGEGMVSLDVSVCCAGPLVEKTIEGRLGVVNTAIEALAPRGITSGLSGDLQAGVQFEGTGASLAEAVDGLAGEGSFTITDFAVTGLAPSVFPAVAGLGDVLNTNADALDALISRALGQGNFSAPSAAGAFSIAGGVARLTNFIVEGAGGRLAGNIDLALPVLGLDGSFVLTPLGFDNAEGLVRSDTARIVTRVAGSLVQPEVTLDLAEMVAAVQVRANELEVDRLEALRAEDAERQRAAAQERNRLIEAQRQRAAAEAERLAAEEAERLAAEEAARQDAEAQRLEEERLARELQERPRASPTPPQLIQSPPLNLGFQPLVNRSFSDPVSQPL